MAKLKINGVEYDPPDASTFTLDEWKLVYEESGLTPDQVETLEGFQPGWIKSLLIITVMRARPELSRKEIAATIGKLTIPDMATVFVEEDDADPPLESEQSESEEPSEPSGETGTDGSTSDPEPATLDSSGQLRSVSTLRSDRKTSVG